jgi:hypothetical protein
VRAGTKVESYEQPGGGETLQFLDERGEYEFEISAWPYTALDVALGEEGAPGTHTDQPESLGVVNLIRADTLHVSFHKNGVAYIITALPDYEEQLKADILPSWQFTD